MSCEQEQAAAPTWQLIEEPAEPDADGEPSVSFFVTNGEERIRLGFPPKPGRGDIYKHENGLSKMPPSIHRWVRENVHYREGDIVVTTYHKCGTTLAEQIVLLLLNGGDAASLDPLSKNSANLHGGLGKVWPEQCIRPDAICEQHDGKGAEEFRPQKLAWFDALPSPRVLKTHCNTSQVPYPGDGEVLTPGVKYVLVTRNPFDACTSAYYHAWSPSKSGIDFDVWVDTWMAYDQLYPDGSWFSWHRDWHHLFSKSDQILWVHYEELLVNPTEEVSRIAQFLQLDFDDKLIARVVQGSSFDSMKAAAVEAKSKDETRFNTSNHLRNGKRGDWRNHFSASSESKLRQAFSDALGETGLCYDLGEGEHIGEAK